MATEEVGIQLTVNAGNSGESVKSIKQQLKEAQQAALQLSEQFGEVSPQALEAAKQVAALRDRVSDLNERAQLFDPGAKFQAFTNVLGSVANGFTAAQGALALFGGESEELQKQLVKLQGAMALSQGLSGIADSWKDFQRLGAVIKTTVVNAFSSLKSAIISTGIGALIVALGLIIANFDKIDEWLQKVIPGFKGFGDLFDKIKVAAFGFFNVLIEQLHMVGEIIGDVLTGQFSAAADTAGEWGKRSAQAYAQGVQQEMAKQAEQAERDAAAALVKVQQNQLKILQAGGAAQAQAADALQMQIKKNTLAAIDSSTNEGKEKYADAQADVEAFQVSLGQKAGQAALKRLQDQQALEMQAAQSAGADTIGLRQKQLAAQWALQKKYGLDTLDTQQAIREQIETDRKSQFDKELKDLQGQQDFELKAATLSGKNILHLRELQLQEQLALYKKYGYSVTDIEKQIADETLDQRTKLNDAVGKRTDQLVDKQKAGLVNVSAAQADLNARNEKASAETGVKIDEQEKAKQALLASTAASYQSLADNAEYSSDIEKGVAAASAAVVAMYETQKQGAMAQTGAVLNAASSLLGTKTKQGKLIASASTLINTYQSATQAYLNGQEAGGPWGIALGIAAAAAAIVAGLANVRKINSVDVTGGGSAANASGPSMPAAPLTATVAPAVATQIQQMAQLNTNMNQAQRVYVVESDITKAQNRVAVLESNAKF